jgi:hypothetical protein
MCGAPCVYLLYIVQSLPPRYINRATTLGNWVHIGARSGSESEQAAQPRKAKQHTREYVQVSRMAALGADVLARAFETLGLVGIWQCSLVCQAWRCGCAVAFRDALAWRRPRLLQGIDLPRLAPVRRVPGGQQPLVIRRACGTVAYLADGTLVALMADPMAHGVRTYTVTPAERGSSPETGGEAALPAPGSGLPSSPRGGQRRCSGHDVSGRGGGFSDTGSGSGSASSSGSGDTAALGEGCAVVRERGQPRCRPAQIIAGGWGSAMIGYSQTHVSLPLGRTAVATRPRGRCDPLAVQCHSPLPSFRCSSSPPRIARDKQTARACMLRRVCCVVYLRRRSPTHTTMQRVALTQQPLRVHTTTNSCSRRAHLPCH